MMTAPECESAFLLQVVLKYHVVADVPGPADIEKMEALDMDTKTEPHVPCQAASIIWAQGACM